MSVGCFSEWMCFGNALVKCASQDTVYLASSLTGLTPPHDFCKTRSNWQTVWGVFFLKMCFMNPKCSVFCLFVHALMISKILMELMMYWPLRYFRVERRQEPNLISQNNLILVLLYLGGWFTGEKSWKSCKFSILVNSLPAGPSLPLPEKET